MVSTHTATEPEAAVERQAKQKRAKRSTEEIIAEMEARLAAKKAKAAAQTAGPGVKYMVAAYRGLEKVLSQARGAGINEPAGTDLTNLLEDCLQPLAEEFERLNLPKPQPRKPRDPNAKKPGPKKKTNSENAGVQTTNSAEANEAAGKGGKKATATAPSSTPHKLQKVK